MKLPISSRVRSRNFWIYALVVIITLSVTTTAEISYLVVQRIILRSLKLNALLTVQQGGDEIDQWLATHKAQLETVANTPIFQTMNWSVVGPYLKAELLRLPDFDLFAMVYPDGSYYTTKIGKAKTNVKDREHVQKGLNGEVFIANPAISRTSYIVNVPMSAPVFSPSSPSKQIIGVAGGSLKLDRVAQVVSRLQYGPKSYAFALNSQGQPIFHPDRNLMVNIDEPAPTFLKSKDPELKNLAQKMVNKNRGIERIYLDNQWVYVAYFPLKQANWSLALVIPRYNIERQLKPLNLLALVLGGLLLIATFAAIRQLLLAEKIRIRAEREALLNRLTQSIRESLELSQILQTTVTELGTLLELREVIFGWHNPEQNCLEIYSQYCESQGCIQPGKFQVSEHFIKQIQRNETIKLTPYSSEFQSEIHLPFFFQARTYLTVSIQTQTSALGYLICFHQTPYFDHTGELEVLQAVADQLAIAINQAHLYDQTQAQVKILDETLKKLKAAQAQLVQSEKMSSLGQLVAGIAHEINNPVNFIYGNLDHADAYTQDLLELVQLYQESYPETTPEIQDFLETIDIDFLQEDFPQVLHSIKLGAERIRAIVLSLRNFSRLDESDKKKVDIHEGIENTLLLLQNQLKSIHLIKKYGNLPFIECYASQINQVFFNLIGNAIDALNEIENQDKTLTITTDCINDVNSPSVKISIQDTGSGIPAEIQNKVFDPFFTTKPVGKGTGLGLSICYQIIVQKHHGKIQLNSSPASGTEFIIEIPVKAEP
jgi:two-component system NtrC family sensor kinase